MEALADLEQWIADGEKATTVSLYTPSKSAESGLRILDTFQPKFMDTIFDDGKVFGYKDLKINIRYRANDMRPHVKVAYKEKTKPIGDREADDIPEILQEGRHLPQVAFVRSSEFEKDSKQQDEDWTPPGTLHSTFTASDGEYEIWRGTLDDPEVMQLNTRVQVFIMMLIRNGSYIGDTPDEESNEPDFSDADRWTLFFLYKKSQSQDNPEKSSYTFVGFSTIYRFFYFQPPTPPASPNREWELPDGKAELTDLPSRQRLSQFIILPPFRGKGKGIQLYQTIFKYYHEQNQTQEFVVEDPSEAFDDLRDICDLAFLRTLPEFLTIKLDTSVSIPKKGAVPQLLAGAEVEEVRRKAKIAPRQFSRVLEMHLMDKLPDSVRPAIEELEDPPEPTVEDKQLERLWQLLAKQRLYRHNKGVMHEIPAEERPEALQNTLESVEYGYAAILAAYDRASKHWQSNGKRKHSDAGSSTTSKRLRMEED